MGRTIALYGDSGSGKTTQIGVYAKYIYQSTGKRTRLLAADLGGFDSIDSLVRLGIIEPIIYDAQANDPWLWVNQSVETRSDGVGLYAFDSGTSMGEALLSSCAKLSANGEDIGGRPAPKFVINKGKQSQLKIGSNVDSHYMTVQGFMRDAIARSTWLADQADVLWTFGLYKGEDQTSQVIYGPQLAGKALTSLMPKWFKYTFPLVRDVVAGLPTKHRLLLQLQPDQNGMATYYANSRYPLDASTPLPLDVSPASLRTAIELIEKGQAEADLINKAELGV